MRDYFIYVGRIDELKGIKILFEAWEQMGTSAPHLIVCGTGPLEDWCYSFLIDNPNLNIEMKGFVPNTEAKKLIANAKALILPTQWYEGFPMTILEAYSVGTPVIGSDIGNVGDLLEEGVTGWKFQYNSVDNLVRVIELAEKKRINNGNIKRVFSEIYSFDANYDCLERIYDQCIKEWEKFYD